MTNGGEDDDVIPDDSVDDKGSNYKNGRGVKSGFQRWCCGLARGSKAAAMPSSSSSAEIKERLGRARESEREEVSHR